MWQASGTMGRPPGGPPYTLTWTPTEITGDEIIVTALTEAEGTEFMVIPVGPTRTLDLSDSVSVLTAVSVLTRIEDLSGDWTPITDPLPEGTVA